MLKNLAMRQHAADVIDQKWWWGYEGVQTVQGKSSVKEMLPNLKMNSTRSNDIHDVLECMKQEDIQ